MKYKEEIKNQNYKLFKNQMINIEKIQNLEKRKDMIKMMKMTKNIITLQIKSIFNLKIKIKSKLQILYLTVENNIKM